MKRFTETGKWDDPWFRQLAGVYKLVFLYIIDRCDNAGFLEIDQDAMAWHTKVKPEHIEGALKGLERGIKGAFGWIWVRRFLKHQKNDPLNPENPSHKQIIGLLNEQRERFKDVPEFVEFIGASKGLESPIGKGKGKKRESPEREAAAAEIYLAYPRREKRPDAIRSILNAFEKIEPTVLLERTKLYAATRPRDQWTPLPASWFNSEQFNDDPDNWKQRNGDAPGVAKAEVEPGYVLDKAGNRYKDTSHPRWQEENS